MTVENLGPRGRRFEYLDILRLACAFSVVMFHYCVVGPYTNTAPTGFYFIPNLLVYGQFGVHVFFVISGFVITISSRGRTAGAFLWARFLRLYPAYWFCCALTALVLVLWGDGHDTYWVPNWPDFLINLTMLQSYVGVGHVDPVYWSLAIELRFYAMVAVLLLARIRIDALPVLGGWILLSAISPYAPAFIGKSVMAGSAPYFIIGILIQSLLLPERRLLKLCMLALAMVLAGRAIFEQHALHVMRNFFPYDPWIAIGVVVCGVALAFACAWAPPPKKIAKVLVMAGAVTYPLYLLHVEVGTILLARFADRAPAPVVGFFVTALVVGVSIAIAQVLEPALRAQLRRLGAFSTRWRSAGEVTRPSMVSPDSAHQPMDRELTGRP